MLVHPRGQVDAHIPVVPGLLHEARDMLLAGLVALHEPEPPGIAGQPLAQRARAKLVAHAAGCVRLLQVARQTRLVLAVARAGGIGVGGRLTVPPRVGGVQALLPLVRAVPAHDRDALTRLVACGLVHAVQGLGGLGAHLVAAGVRRDVDGHQIAGRPVHRLQRPDLVHHDPDRRRVVDRPGVQVDRPGRGRRGVVVLGRGRGHQPGGRVADGVAASSRASVIITVEVGTMTAASRATAAVAVSTARAGSRSRGRGERRDGRHSSRPTIGGRGADVWRSRARAGRRRPGRLLGHLTAAGPPPTAGPPRGRRCPALAAPTRPARSPGGTSRGTRPGG
jgi:hypothetical protein